MDVLPILASYGYLTLVLGVFCCGISAWLARYFWNLEAPLANRISVMLAGEWFVLTSTTLIAAAEMFGWLEEWSDGVHSSWRVAVYLVASLTSIHLYFGIRKIEEGN